MTGERAMTRRVTGLREDISPAARGFALVSALFLIVIVSLLAAVALRLSMGQQQTVTMALQQARALSAARSGIQWAAYNALKPVGASCAGATLNMTEAALAGFTVAVTCTATPFTDGGINPSTGVSTTYQSYLIGATATRGTFGTAEFVQRVVRATFTNEN
jgi:MSHA biogenesis protein MshP